MRTCSPPHTAKSITFFSIGSNLRISHRNSPSLYVSPTGCEISGLVVLVRHGVFAWMNACSACSVSLRAKLYTQTEAEPVIPQGLHTDIVLILAGMLLHGYLEARA